MVLHRWWRVFTFYLNWQPKFDFYKYLAIEIWTINPPIRIFWGYFQDILGIFSGYNGDIFGIFWGYFGDILHQHHHHHHHNHHHHHHHQQGGWSCPAKQEQLLIRAKSQAPLLQVTSNAQNQNSQYQFYQMKVLKSWQKIPLWFIWCSRWCFDWWQKQECQGGNFNLALPLFESQVNPDNLNL